MVGADWIGNDPVNPSRREIDLTTTGAGNIACRTPWLVIHDPIVDGLLHLIEISLREMVAVFGKVIVDRGHLGREHGLRHTQWAYSS